MTKPRRQHTIPQFILRHFVEDKGRIYYFRKSNVDRGIIPTTPKNTFVEGDAYSIRTLEEAIDVSVENKFSKIESLAALSVSKILEAIRNDRMPSLTQNDRIALNWFIYHQATRVPDVTDRIVAETPFEQMVQDAKEQILAQGGTVPLEQERELIESKDQLLHNARVMAVGTTSEKVMPYLEKRGLTILHIVRDDMCFVIGSNPMLRSTRNGKSHLADLDVELHLPVASDTALVLHGSSPEKFIVRVVKDRDWVRDFNERVFAQSSATASGSRQLLVSLARRFNYPVR